MSRPEGLIHEFELNSDTAASFWDTKKEGLAGREIVRSKVYEDYLNFCNDQRIPCEPPHTFAKRFRNLLVSKGLMEARETWQGKLRTYRFAPLGGSTQVPEPQKSYSRQEGETKEQYVRRVGINTLLEAYERLPYDRDGRTFFLGKADERVFCSSPTEWVRWIASQKQTAEWQEILAKFEELEK